MYFLIWIFMLENQFHAIGRGEKSFITYFLLAVRGVGNDELLFNSEYIRIGDVVEPDKELDGGPVFQSNTGKAFAALYNMRFVGAYRRNGRLTAVDFFEFTIVEFYHVIILLKILLF